MSDLLDKLYHMTFESSAESTCKADELNDITQKIISCLGEKNAGLLEAYDMALYNQLVREDRAFFLKTLSLGMELGRLSVS